MENKNVKDVTLERIKVGEEEFFKIANSDQMRPFFMSIVSDSNHWMFISSNGGLSAGRQNAEFALFPYYTDDKITESADITGSKTILKVKTNEGISIWEPFADRYRGKYQITRNLYKNVYGNKIIFEEINHDLALTFRYEWNSTNTYGFVKKSKLINNGSNTIDVEVLDGLQNLIPYGVGSELQNRSSNLVDAYKRSELDAQSGVGIFALSAIIVDKAEPSEALKANVVWSLGVENPTYLLSSLQLDAFRKGEQISQETDVKAEKGAYFIKTEFSLESNQEKEWLFIADVNKNHSDVVEIIHQIQHKKDLKAEVLQKIEDGTQRLIQLNASADAIQLSNDNLRDTRHFSNTLFNIMRGGIFDEDYTIEKWDFKDYLKKANCNVFKNYESIIDALAEQFTLFDLRKLIQESDDLDFIRLASEYLPLKFSRRHGDPSRPWNKFSINTRNEDGSKILDYEGNWRDIFQNWEALAVSYPEFMENMIHKFLNASTFDGYNPYRVTKDGFDWETIEPDDPWSYIGYWGDHQIIYLLKFLEFLQKHNPGRLAELFNQEVFVYANVPYKIKPYADIEENPKDTIDFDHTADEKIRTLREKIGADGALLRDENGEVVRANFIEKILATTLAKLSNFILEGGIWMNTQRPEWNDANNALVGNGVSMVTLYYLHRFVKFLGEILETTDLQEVKVSNELVDFYKTVRSVFEDNAALLSKDISDQERKEVLDALGKAASEFRWHVYDQSFWGKKRSISLDGLKRFTDVTLKFIQHSIKANKRKDDLYHAYNIMSVEEEGVQVSYLSEMLEGQVAVLSAKYLKPKEALAVLDGLKNSALFREDQYSYILYPNKQLPGFLEKNTIPQEEVQKSSLLSQMIESCDTRLVNKDINGDVHFNGNFKNANDLKAALENLEAEDKVLAQKEEKQLLATFEKVFNHKAFTGRSGTFFGYEGLGSIYWHMVSKLQLAVQEVCLQAIEEKADDNTIGKLLEHYYEINAGIGVHKSPKLYGAFPTDPYSHTPAGKGAQQPGMTGQVKEDILSRFGELGVFVQDGQIYFKPALLKKDEFLSKAENFEYVDVQDQMQSVELQANQLAFTYCQVLVIYEVADKNAVEITFTDGETEQQETLQLSKEVSDKIFHRNYKVQSIKVMVNKDILK